MNFSQTHLKTFFLSQLGDQDLKNKVAENRYNSGLSVRGFPEEQIQIFFFFVKERGDQGLPWWSSG